MPEYVEKALDILQHINPKRPQYAPHHWTVPDYVKILHMAPDPGYSDLLEKIVLTKMIQIIFYNPSKGPMQFQYIGRVLITSY